MANIRIRRNTLNQMMRGGSHIITPKEGLLTRPVLQSSHPDFQNVSLLNCNDNIPHLFEIDGHAVHGILTNTATPAVQNIIPRHGANLIRFDIHPKDPAQVNNLLSNFDPSFQNTVRILSQLPSARIPLFEMLMVRDEEHFGESKEPAYNLASLAQSLAAKIDDPIVRLFRKVPWQIKGIDMPDNLSNIDINTHVQIGVTSTLLRYEHNGQTFTVPYPVNRTLLSSVLDTYATRDFNSQAVNVDPTTGMLRYNVANSDAFSTLPADLSPRYMHQGAENIHMLVSPDRVGDIPFLIFDRGARYGIDIPERLRFLFLMRNLGNALSTRAEGPYHFEGEVDIEPYRTLFGRQRISISGTHLSPEVHRVSLAWLGSLGIKWGEKLYSQGSDELTLTVIENDNTETVIQNPLNFIVRRPEGLTEIDNAAFPRVVAARAHGGMVIAKYQRTDGSRYWDWAPEEALLSHGYIDPTPVTGGLALINYTYGANQHGTTVYPIENTLNPLQRLFDRRKVLFNPTTAKRVIEMKPSEDLQTLTAIVGKRLNPLSPHNIDPILYKVKPEVLYFNGLSKLGKHSIKVDRDNVEIISDRYQNSVSIPRTDFTDWDEMPLYGNIEHPIISSPDNIYFPSSDLPWLHKYRPRIGTFLGWASDKVPRTAGELEPETHLWKEAFAMLYPVDKIDIGASDLQRYIPEGAMINSIAYSCPASAIQVEIGNTEHRFWIPLTDPLGNIDDLHF